MKKALLGFYLKKASLPFLVPTMHSSNGHFGQRYDAATAATSHLRHESSPPSCLFLLIGLGVFGSSLCALFWNECHFVRDNRILMEVKRALAFPQCFSKEASFVGKLVYLQCDLSHLDTFTEKPNLDVTLTAAQIRRHVEMYQWKENRTERREVLPNGDTNITIVYNYWKDWSDIPILSSLFYRPTEFHNPEFWPLSGVESWSDDVHFGGFRLPYALLHGSPPASASSGIHTFTPILLQRIVNPIPSPVSRPPPFIADNNTYLLGNTLYTSNPEKPQVGDMRLWWTAMTVTRMTVLAMQQPNGTLVPWKSQLEPSNSVFLSREGSVSVNEMLRSIPSANMVVVNLLRALGVAFLWTGLALVGSPLGMAWAPTPITSICGAGVGAGTILASVILAGRWFAQPVLALILMILLVVLLKYVSRCSKRGMYVKISDHKPSTNPTQNPEDPSTTSSTSSVSGPNPYSFGSLPKPSAPPIPSYLYPTSTVGKPSGKRSSWTPAPPLATNPDYRP